MQGIHRGSVDRGTGEWRSVKVLQNAGRQGCGRGQSRSGRKGKAKGQASKQMFYAGMNYDNWDEEQGWGDQNAYKESWEGM